MVVGSNPTGRAIYLENPDNSMSCRDFCFLASLSLFIPLRGQILDF
ncbi:hypothetical protein VAE308_910001 [Vibrio aestuarianus]|nr:hypothetical protein VAE308_910001 [Vibrio aestuarianus]